LIEKIRHDFPTLFSWDDDMKLQTLKSLSGSLQQSGIPINPNEGPKKISPEIAGCAALPDAQREVGVGGWGMQESIEGILGSHRTGTYFGDRGIKSCKSMVK